MEFVTSADRPELRAETTQAFSQAWPEFVFHDTVVPRYIDRVERYFAAYHVLVLDEGKVVAGGWAVPLAWDGVTGHLPDGYDGALAASVDGHEAGSPPTTLCFMAASVAGAHAGRGLAGVVLDELKRRGTADGLDRVVAPLRPTSKHRYPTTPMADFAGWRREDGLSVDPWVRTHQRMGAEVLAVAPRSMHIVGSVADWESWADMVFPVSGEYVVPGALNLVSIDRAEDRGTYTEENLWVRHPAASPVVSVGRPA